MSVGGALRTAGAVAVAAAVFAAPASAHLRSGTVAVDYRATVTHSSTPAYDVQIYQSDHGLRLTAKRGHTVVMLGYLGEAVFRLDRAGLWVNAASPTAFAVGLLKRADAVDTAAPHWRLEPGRRSVSWHDARAQSLAPGIERGPWSMPITVDGRPARLEGELERFAAPSPWVWCGLLAGLLAASAALLRRRGRGGAGSAAVGLSLLASAAAVLLALAFALDPYASPGTWIEGLDAMAFLAAGLGVLLRGADNLRVGAAIGLGLVALAVGLLDVAVFLHPIVLAVVPATLTRLLVLIAVAAGVGAAALGCLFYAETTPWAPTADDPFGFRAAGGSAGIVQR